MSSRKGGSGASSALRREMKSAGSHFFDRNTMRAFHSKLHSVYALPYGYVFVTSEVFSPSEGRVYKVRQWTSGHTPETLGQRSSLANARLLALQVARRLRP